MVLLGLAVAIAWWIRAQQPRWNGLRPPIVGAAVPYVGAALSFGQHATRFLQHCRKEHGDVFGVSRVCVLCVCVSVCLDVCLFVCEGVCVWEGVG